jgi:hypothetical protein
VDPSKVRDVLNWSSPKNVPEIRSFLGLVGYFVDSSRDSRTLSNALQLYLRRVRSLSGMKSVKLV